MKTLRKAGLVMALLFSINSWTGCGPSTFVTTGVHYANPPWAPPYYTGVRYYYLPDIESYYDLSDGEFVYLDNGQWLFAPGLPRAYASYDLFTGFVIALDVSVFEPWMHHQYYVSHYPRFYYRNVYPGRDMPGIRGFNENDRKPINWRSEDRSRINELRGGNAGVRKIENPRAPQNSNYYGRNIGKPVKVRPQMREGNKGKRGR